MQACRNRKLNILVRLNEWRCQASPMYGWDLRDSVAMTERSTKLRSYTGAYLTVEQAAHRIKPWEYGNFLKESTHTPEDRLEELKDIIQR